MKPSHLLTLTLLGIVLIFGGVMVYSNQSRKPATSKITITPQASGASQTNSSSTLNQQVKEFTITTNNDTFIPSSLTVNQGDTVRVIFKNNSGLHTLTIPDFNQNTGAITGNQSKTLGFVANKAGTFQFFCQFHKVLGMTGTLTVQ